MESSENNPKQPEAQVQQPVDADRKTMLQSFEFSIGGILGSTFATTLKNPLLFIGMALLAIVPITVIIALLPMSPQAAAITSAILVAILSLVIQAAITYAVFKIMTGNKASFASAVGRGFSRFFPVLIASILVGIGVGIGMMLLVIPGIIIMCICAVTIPACVVERMGAIDSISRSAYLTKGCRLKIFALMLILGIISFLIQLIIPIIVVAITTNMVVVSLVVALVASLPLAFQCVMTATIYYELRRIKEGVTVDSLVSVFD